MVHGAYKLLTPSDLQKFSLLSLKQFSWAKFIKRLEYFKLFQWEFLQLISVIFFLNLGTIDAGNVRLFLRWRLKEKTYLVLIRPHLEYCVLLWASGQKVEQVQLRATRMVGAVRQEPWEWQQRDPGDRQPRAPQSSHCLLGSYEEMPPAALRMCKARGGETEGINWESWFLFDT